MDCLYNLQQVYPYRIISFIYISFVFPETQTSQADGFPPEEQNSSQTPMDPETSVIQVKLELSTTQQDLELPKQSCPAPACSPEHSDRSEESHRDIPGKRKKFLSRRLITQLMDRFDFKQTHFSILKK